MTRQVLVTRPQPGADESAARLRALGFAPIVLPLTTIVPCKPTLLPDPMECDAVALTSVNAVRYAPAELLAGLAGKPAFAVGDVTAAAAREAGFTVVRSASGDARDLVRLVAATLPAGARLLHLAGAHRTEGFAEALEQAGYAVEIREIYRAKEIDHSPAFLRERLSGTEIWGAMVMSPRGATLLKVLVQTEEFTEAFERAVFFCISDRAAAPLAVVAPGRIVVSPAPSEDAVLHAMSSQA